MLWLHGLNRLINRGNCGKILEHRRDNVRDVGLKEAHGPDLKGQLE